MSLAACRKGGGNRIEASGLHLLSCIHERQGQLQVAYALAYESEICAELAGDFYAKSLALHQRGRICTDLGCYSQALSIFTQEECLLDAVGIEPKAVSRRFVKNMQSEVHLRKTEYDDARRLNEFLVSLNVEGSSKSYALFNIATIDIATNTCHNPASTEHNIEVARQHFLSMGIRVGVSECEVTLGALRSHQGDHKTAIQIYRQVVASICCGSLTVDPVIMPCFQGLSECMDLTGNHEDFFHYTVLYLVSALKLSDHAAIYRAIRRLGDVLLQQQDEQTALHLWELALGGLTRMDIHRERAECMIRIGDHMRGEGKLSEAQDLWRAAIPLFMRSSQEGGVARCEKRLGELYEDTSNRV